MYHFIGEGGRDHIQELLLIPEAINVHSHGLTAPGGGMHKGVYTEGARLDQCKTESMDKGSIAVGGPLVVPIAYLFLSVFN